jgi:hypothetical protein
MGKFDNILNFFKKKQETEQKEPEVRPVIQKIIDSISFESWHFTPKGGYVYEVLSKKVPNIKLIYDRIKMKSLLTIDDESVSINKQEDKEITFKLDMLLMDAADDKKNILLKMIEEMEL